MSYNSSMAQGLNQVKERIDFLTVLIVGLVLRTTTTLRELEKKN